MNRYINANLISYEQRDRLGLGIDYGTTDRSTYEIAYKSQIDKIPTADVEEVVRCKDCLFMVYQFGVGDNILGCRRNGLNMIDGNGYCAWAQKMDREVCK